MGNNTLPDAPPERIEFVVRDGEKIALVNVPKRIWLQTGFAVMDAVGGDEINFQDLDELTWCQDDIEHGDIEYVRADIAARSEGEAIDDTTLRGSVEITVFRGDQILAVNSRSFDGFCGVGGKVEVGESFEQAARRELLEETGCEALSLKFIAGHSLDPIVGDDQRVRWYCAGFVADIGDQVPKQSEEGTTPFWTTKENMIANSLFPQWYSWWFGILSTSAPAADEVERAGDELRTFWPGCSYQINCFSAAGFHKPTDRWFEIDIISTDYKLHGEHFKGDTLAEAMQAVREWKKEKS